MKLSLKYVILKLAGLIFETDAEMDAYIFNIFLSNNLFGMVLFPVAVLLFLYPQFSESKPVFIGIDAELAKGDNLEIRFHYQL